MKQFVVPLLFSLSLSLSLSLSHTHSLTSYSRSGVSGGNPIASHIRPKRSPLEQQEVKQNNEHIHNQLLLVCVIVGLIPKMIIGSGYEASEQAIMNYASTSACVMV